MRHTSTIFALAALPLLSFAELDLTSQHLDIEESSFFLRGMLTTETEFGSYGKTDIAEAEIGMDFGKIDGILWGTLGLRADAHAYWFLDNPGLDALPDALMDVSATPCYTIRFMTGWSFAFSASPGFYSDASNPAFSCPFTVNSYFAACPELSFLIGGTFRPGWDIGFVPNIGLAWQPCDLFRLELGCPESRVDLFPGHILSFFGTVKWRNVTYALEDVKGLPDSLTMDDIYASAGVSLRILGSWYVMGEAGTFLERELSADVAKDKAIKLSKEPFIRVSLQSVF